MGICLYNDHYMCGLWENELLVLLMKFLIAKTNEKAGKVQSCSEEYEVEEETCLIC